MYVVKFTNGSLQFVNQDNGDVLYDQPFRPAIDGDETRPWIDENEAFEYWTTSARIMYRNIPDDEITVDTKE